MSGSPTIRFGTSDSTGILKCRPICWLVSKPVPAKLAGDKDLLCKQLAAEVRQIARDLGPAIRKDCPHVARSGAYFQVSFVWPLGRAGLLLKQEQKPEAFSFLIRPWVRKHRN